MQRVIKVESLKDGQQYEFIDNGVTRDGDDSTRRQELMRHMRKRVRVDGLDEVPLFRVLEIGPWKVAQGESQPVVTERMFDFERVLNIAKIESKEQLAIWKQHQSVLIEQSRQRKLQVEQQAERMQGVHLAQAMSQLAETINSKAVVKK